MKEDGTIESIDGKAVWRDSLQEYLISEFKRDPSNTVNSGIDAATLQNASNIPGKPRTLNLSILRDRDNDTLHRVHRFPEQMIKNIFKDAINGLGSSPKKSIEILTDLRMTFLPTKEEVENGESAYGSHVARRAFLETFYRDSQCKYGNQVKNLEKIIEQAKCGKISSFPIDMSPADMIQSATVILPESSAQAKSIQDYIKERDLKTVITVLPDLATVLTDLSNSPPNVSLGHGPTNSFNGATPHFNVNDGSLTPRSSYIKKNFEQERYKRFKIPAQKATASGALYSSHYSGSKTHETVQSAWGGAKERLNRRDQ